MDIFERKIMKRAIILLFAALLTIGLATAGFAAQSAAPVAGTGKKNLIVYYSLSGNTKIIAENLHALVGGDIVEIKTVRPYPDNFHAVVEQAREERRANFLPPIQAIGIRPQDYDTVYLGFPVWGSTIPQPIATFLSQNDLAGKTVIPFCTHDGYGVGRGFQVLSEYWPKAEILPGFDMLGSNARDARELLTAWLDRIGVAVSSAGANRTNAAGTPITITIGNTVLAGVLNDGPVARKFMEMLPVTVSMGQFGGREFYGSSPERIPTDVEGRLRFDDGDITYCPQNNSVAIFYAQTDRPNLTMRVIPLGRVISELSVFHDMNQSVQMTFNLAK
jgi:flavodoxin